MNRGQIFSIDFLIAMILMIFFLGLILSLGELQGYERKEERIRYELASKTEAALISLINSPQFSCELDNNSFLAYSLDFNKIDNISTKNLKEAIGLDGYNLSLSINYNQFPKHDEILTGKNIYVTDVKILYCNKGVSFYDLNNCMNSTCTGNVENQTLQMKVIK